MISLLPGRHTIDDGSIQKPSALGIEETFNTPSPLEPVPQKKTLFHKPH